MRHVIGPLGNVLTHETLPPAGTARWTPRKKAEIVTAVTSGLISLPEACAKYGLSTEEFVNWQNKIDAFGIAGLIFCSRRTL